MIYGCLQQPAILEPEPEENPASLFDNDDNVEIVVQDNDTDMVPRTEISSRRSSSHYSVPPTTDSDRDVAMPGADEDSDEPGPEAIHANLPSNHRQQSSKLNSSTQSGVCDFQKILMISSSTFSSSGSTSEGISCRGLYRFLRRPFVNYYLLHTETEYTKDWEQEKREVIETGININIFEYRVASACVACFTIYRQESFTQQSACLCCTCCPTCNFEALRRNSLGRRVP
jgi:hypothetical protein